MRLSIARHIKQCVRRKSAESDGATDMEGEKTIQESLERPSAAKSHLSESAQLCVSIIRHAMVDMGINAQQELSSQLATNPQFIGSLLGLIDFVSSRRGEDTQNVYPQVVFELFGIGNSSAMALQLIWSGNDSPQLMRSLEGIQEQLVHAEREEMEDIFMYFRVFFR